MKTKTDKNLIVGLDVGTSKIVAIVGEHTPGEPVEIIGIGSHAAHGLKRGVVVDIDSTTHSIQRAIEEAELMAGCQIRSVYASIAGSHIRDENSHGTAPIRDREVSAADLDAVLNSACAIAIPADRSVLYREPQEYLIDGQEGIRHPIGMFGVRLEANVHLVTGAASTIQNISKCINRCGLQVDELLPAAVASARAVLTADERELGVCMVDIGAGTTDIAVYTHGALRHTASLAIGGDQVTADIAHLMRTPTAHAEELKVRYACALAQLAHAEETIQVPSVGDRPPRRLARQNLAEAVQPRYEEIFEMVQADLQRSGRAESVRAGIVLTGGAARMEGALDLAEELFHMPVRLGTPQHVTGLADVVANPMQATGVGLLLYGSRGGATRSTGSAGSAGVGGLWGRISTWFKGEF
ncbi:MAG: cell division protein FtsA [Xanthomonadales bacterium]|nr:cell division protein FtsA [Xanthomonadales bacterium]MCC6596731.1 cell division protein FtsA [Rhodanobacteraceae bacterium]MDL1869172.1 cell division protein FtsA [Gammaproteobacteria bacterium PRO6]